MPNSTGGSHGAPMGMPRSNLMHTLEDAQAMTVFVAQAVAAVITVAEIALFMVLVPAILRVYAEKGIAPFGLTAAIDWLDWYGLALMVLLVNGIVFWICERLGRRYWLGIAFIPSFIYGFVTFSVLVSAIVPIL